MLAKSCHCGGFAHDVHQPFRAIPSSSDMYCTLDGALRLSAYVQYVCDSVYLYDLFKRHPAPGLGTRSTAMRPGYEAWVRGQEHISCFISDLNCKTMDRQERLRQRREYERARCYAETAEQKDYMAIHKCDDM